MAKNLRYISINFPFTNPSVEQRDNLAIKEALFDFDVVVIRPYLLAGCPAGRCSVRWNALQGAKHEMATKREDLARLLSQGGLLVVILDAVQELVYTTEGYSHRERYTVTNYDFLDDGFYCCVRNGNGDRVDYLKPSEPFTSVIKGSSVEWTAFIVDRPPYPFCDVEFFARNGAGSFVGGSLGSIIFLPNFKQLNEREFFQACLDYRRRYDGMPAPDWLKTLPGTPLKVSDSRPS